MVRRIHNGQFITLDDGCVLDVEKKVTSPSVVFVLVPGDSKAKHRPFNIALTNIFKCTQNSHTKTRFAFLLQKPLPWVYVS